MRIFIVDFYIMQLEGYAVVLDTQWLQILGSIRWDFETLEMHFVWNMEHIVLHRIKNRFGRSREFLSLHPKEAKNSKRVLKQNWKEKKEEMEQMLEENEVVFAKPREQPLPRSHDHRNILQKGAGPISVKPTSIYFF